MAFTRFGFLARRRGRGGGARWAAVGRFCAGEERVGHARNKTRMFCSHGCAPIADGPTSEWLWELPFLSMGVVSKVAKVVLQGTSRPCGVRVPSLVVCVNTRVDTRVLNL